MSPRRHLLSVDDLSDSEISQLCTKALKEPPRAERIDPRKPAVGLIFMEPSTRTRTSFERAAQRLGRPTIHLTAEDSSLTKGETVQDTLANLASLNVSSCVIRFSHDFAAADLRHHRLVSVINAGDGTREHPTQALLDLCTLQKVFGAERLKGLKLAIVGDLRHSRVAASWARLAPRMGIDLTLVAPAEWAPTSWGAKIPLSSEGRSALKSQDVVMALRVQKERMASVDMSVVDRYIRDFRIHASDLGPQQKLMHPGPVNWGVELSLETQEDPRTLILEQVRCGLDLRAALLDFLDPV
jgi:aspartate carbamoyltransferase catalytic subunit